jgi:uridylate kinase
LGAGSGSGCQRVLLKLSGEALMGAEPFGINTQAIDAIAAEVVGVASSGVQTAIVVGGGNIFRGLGRAARDMDRVAADNMGMLATVMNGLALQDRLERLGVPTRVQSALPVANVVEPYVRRTALEHLQAGRVVVFVAGTGNPYFTTDTAASLRAVEVQAQLLVKATKVDGVYTADPVSNPQAKRYDVLSYDAALEQRLGVMDATAIALCRENDMPIRVCSISEPQSMLRVVRGEHVGTLVNREGKL